MLASFGTALARAFRHVVPDPFVIAVILTAATIGLAWWQTDTGPGELVAAWSDSGSGVWKFLAFGMQMCLILVTGFAVAASRPFAAIIRGLASLPRSCAQAALLVAFIAAGLGVAHWGLGLIGGALLARDTTKRLRERGIEAPAPLLAAAGYTGMLVWHGGFSGSAPLKMTSAAEVASVFPEGVDAQPLALSETVLSPLNLVATGGLLVIIPVVYALLSPKRAPAAATTTASEADSLGGGEAHTSPPAEPVAPATANTETESDRPGPLVRLLEGTPLINWLLAVLVGAWALGFYAPGLAHEWTGGVLGSEGAASGALRLNPNTLNLTFLLLALVLHGSPRSLLSAIEEAASGCAGIILQFPLYAGIMGVMAGSGLLALMSDSIAGSASAGTLPLLSMCSAAVVNVFVPSGGGQWAIQGPLAMESATALGVDPGKMVMAVAYGDQLTNMLQPFWALPLLAITGVKARDVVGYAAIAMVVAAVWLGLVLIVM